MTRIKFTPPLKNGINQYDTFWAGEQISRNIPPARSLMSHPTFCDQNFLGIQC